MERGREILNIYNSQTFDDLAEQAKKEVMAKYDCYQVMPAMKEISLKK